MLENEGIKYDEGKLRFDLIPPSVEKEIAKVLTFGANKYSPNNWQEVRPFRDRYLGAKRRHENARLMGEMHDPETGILHSAHEAVNALFLLWGDIKEQDRVNSIEEPNDT